MITKMAINNRNLQIVAEQYTASKQKIKIKIKSSNAKKGAKGKKCS